MLVYGRIQMTPTSSFASDQECTVHALAHERSDERDLYTPTSDYSQLIASPTRQLFLYRRSYFLTS
jgi:hypothetical protein